ncbi:NADPH:quinone reductase [Lipingzhangella sp. LS1_29]|uniref:NADPH:quinone reductase n=1 Tax=Lipingzhangella rawalii TaxID=2055835 RepID=A0ABU2H645_9ACTN|nr:NADPH:quinone reductase [Lipingzhangella rawalii]MDS1270777.1 NADPH:quinone reductase [Lipingzhangella rawalii]
MRSAYIEELGPSDIIRHGELPEPRPGPTDVLVDVEIAAVNHVDTFVRSGAWRTPVPFPFVVGRDLVGTVAATGPGVPDFADGDRVWCLSMGHAGRQGVAAERAVVPADRLYHLPEGVDAVDAAAMAHPGATAYLALFTHGRMRPGETVVVIGAAGNVGSAAVTLAVNAGARVIAVAAARDTEYCRSLGADVVIDYRTPDVHRRIRDTVPAGADLYIDAAGRNDLEDSLEVLTSRGRLVLLAGMNTRAVLPVGALYLADRSIVGFAISKATITELAEAAGHVGRLVAAGKLRPRQRELLPLSAAATAHRDLESGNGAGRRFLLQVRPD